MIREPTHSVGFDRNIWIWEEPKNENSYLLVADVARGDGADSSTFHVFKLETMEIICEYKGKPTPDIFSEIINTTGLQYNNAMVVIENNSVGFHVLEKVN